MPRNLNKHLLTHYPLLWNTRIVWMACILLSVHLFFFLAGFADLTAVDLQEYYSLSNVFSPGLVIFSVLCSLGIIIIWLVFYLRNNAFKSFYIIDKYHSTKEFFIIFLILFLSITFYESYRMGAWLKSKTITGREQLVKEANIVNLAGSFIPVSKAEYFKLNNCGDDRMLTSMYDEGHDYYDTAHISYYDTNSIKIRVALEKPDAFSYKNYCNSVMELEGYRNFVPTSQWIATRNRWIDDHAADSIKYILDECLVICRKYGIDQNINTEKLTSLVFRDSFNNITQVLGARQYDYDNTGSKEYFYRLGLEKALEFAEECHMSIIDTNGFTASLTTEIYVALCLSILFLCYRLYSRRVFLFSIIGSIVWAIIFALIGSSSASVNTIAWFYLILFGLFITIAGVSISNGNPKTATGMLLNWHIYMLPFVVMIIILLISENYHHHRYLDGAFRALSDAELKQKYPVGYWVDHYEGLLFRLNLLFVFLYTALFFTRLSKKWHIMPEE